LRTVRGIATQELAVPTEPMRIFDAHLHIIDPRFPLVANHGYLPEPFTVPDYRLRMAQHRLVGGAVVSGSFQAFDQQYLLDALHRLGPGFVGVTQLPASASDRQILALDALGVRAVRFNLKRGGSEDVTQLERLACRVHEMVGWHTELYADAATLYELKPLLLRLPALSIDHLGLSRAGLPLLLKLAERGVRVKATGFGRVCFDVRSVLQDLNVANPAALMFGTDLPSTRAPRPFDDADVRLVRDALGEAAAKRVLSTNALQWYRLPSFAERYERAGVDMVNSEN
jgi:predicted TIM-barrel fold metal-dependent hydrolase